MIEKMKLREIIGEDAARRLDVAGEQIDSEVLAEIGRWCRKYKGVGLCPIHLAETFPTAAVVVTRVMSAMETWPQMDIRLYNAVFNGIMATVAAVVIEMRTRGVPEAFPKDDG